ncbi:hypothetical protein EDB83DRAFT_2520779 [Lactarius deliciosus]|nr:hypothetical protein EDB83DRAFT_2520779 [Lactarius deliciosus]
MSMEEDPHAGASGGSGGDTQEPRVTIEENSASPETHEHEPVMPMEEDPYAGAPGTDGDSQEPHPAVEEGLENSDRPANLETHEHSGTVTIPDHRSCQAPRSPLSPSLTMTTSSSAKPAAGTSNRGRRPAGGVTGTDGLDQEAIQPDPIEPSEFDIGSDHPIRLPDLQTTQHFIDTLRTAVLEDTGMELDDIEQLRSPEPEHVLEDPSPLLRSLMLKWGYTVNPFDMVRVYDVISA